MRVPGSELIQTPVPAGSLAEDPAVRAHRTRITKPVILLAIRSPVKRGAGSSARDPLGLKPSVLSWICRRSIFYYII